MEHSDRSTRKKLNPTTVGSQRPLGREGDRTQRPLGLIYTFLLFISPTNNFLAPCLQSIFNINNPQQQQQREDSSSLIRTTSTTGCGGELRLRGVFVTFDKNNDGYIMRHDLRESFQKIGIAAGERDVDEMVQKVVHKS
ncbi:hypothetical protein C2S53_006085 [Perilla frutescens var. hirtella]|uniref:EF-hand domain-containing protein n=1 Tax=Perilla frutescens var. hirtella TaxID=608512 RepID=A0AAD4JKW3_PERFH|nr:hypothetical protein C2S53_006085 [Perilla frutescens var. hirtella]